MHIVHGFIILLETIFPQLTLNTYYSLNKWIYLRLTHSEILSSFISTSSCVTGYGWPCNDGFNVRSAIGLPLTSNGSLAVCEIPLLSSFDNSSGWILRCPVDIAPLNPFCSVVWPGAAGVAAAAAASSRAFFSLNCLYVVVFGITSARKSRLSIRATALACAGQHTDIANLPNETHQDPCTGCCGVVSVRP